MSDTHTHLSEAMTGHGWTRCPENTYERKTLTTFSLCVERLDGSLSVFTANRDGGGSLTIPADTEPSDMARIATEFAT